MPESTLRAFLHHGVVKRTLEENLEEAESVMVQ